RVVLAHVGDRPVDRVRGAAHDQRGGHDDSPDASPAADPGDAGVAPAAQRAQAQAKITAAQTAPRRRREHTPASIDADPAGRYGASPAHQRGASAARPPRLPAQPMERTPGPAIAAPRVAPLANRPPGPDSLPASQRFSDFTRCSTSQRTTPPANIPADVVIGR